MSSSGSRAGVSSRRPYVICHMVPSVDGRIVTSAWRLPRGLVAEYEQTGSSFGADAWIIGRGERASRRVFDRGLHLVVLVLSGHLHTGGVVDQRRGRLAGLHRVADEDRPDPRPVAVAHDEHVAE